MNLFLPLFTSPPSILNNWFWLSASYQISLCAKLWQVAVWAILSGFSVQVLRIICLPSPELSRQPYSSTETWELSTMSQTQLRQVVGRPSHRPCSDLGRIFNMATISLRLRTESQYHTLQYHLRSFCQLSDCHGWSSESYFCNVTEETCGGVYSAQE